jgi:hypothetical protein
MLHPHVNDQPSSYSIIIGGEVVVLEDMTSMVVLSRLASGSILGFCEASLHPNIVRTTGW